jgi:hypothetical protein
VITDLLEPGHQREDVHEGRYNIKVE